MTLICHFSRTASAITNPSHESLPQPPLPPLWRAATLRSWTSVGWSRVRTTSGNSVWLWVQDLKQTSPQWDNAKVAITSIPIGYLLFITMSFILLFWFYFLIYTAFNIGIKYVLFTYFDIFKLLTILECTIYFVLYLLVIQPPGSIKYSRSRSQLITLSGHKGIGS